MNQSQEQQELLTTHSALKHRSKLRQRYIASDERDNLEPRDKYDKCCPAKGSRTAVDESFQPCESF